RLKEHYFVRDGRLLFTVPLLTSDIDIFFLGNKSSETAVQIADLLIDLGGNSMVSNDIYLSEFATSFGGPGHSVLKVQLIKRQYNSVEEILVGFDIDASRVALVKNIHKQHLTTDIDQDLDVKMVVDPSYITAVKYGINLI